MASHYNCSPSQEIKLGDAPLSSDQKISSTPVHHENEILFLVDCSNVQNSPSSTGLFELGFLLVRLEYAQAPLVTLK